MKLQACLKTIACAATLLALGMSSKVALAAGRTFLLASPLPLPIQVRVLGSGPQFPQVVNVPAPPAPPVPVPYPELTMRLQIRLPNGQWSPTQQVPWRPGPVVLPKP